MARFAVASGVGGRGMKCGPGILGAGDESPRVSLPLPPRGGVSIGAVGIKRPSLRQEGPLVWMGECTLRV